MNTAPMPAQWDSIVSPTILYWQGLRFLEREWKRTQAFGDARDDIDALHEYLFWRKNLVIWACCAIEAFVNEEGVSWLGELFYKRNLERLRVSQKIEVLYALKYRRQLDADSQTLKHVKGLFDLRNRLVHPKTRELANGRNGENDVRAHLDNVTPRHLRQVFWSMTSLFNPLGVGELES